MLHLPYLAGLDRSRHLPPDSPETFAGLFRHCLHIFGLEVDRRPRRGGLACREGIGHGNVLRPLTVYLHQISQMRLKTIIVSRFQ